ncbi:UDP-glucose 4-epimerase GalE [Limnobaculum parvum]|uniref:UDP-glucose 4-epimerase n=1 Tax=Limnobaculum parvum TaxID=2172103 RepID=A0A2Y9U0Z7_9GAMM|nr:UDP-glucose 4-epimerase GalE [Limnobaculum parvum]AWH89657.1 UDP-glucose 4-epimerase GalE [Limnobaculum parvum]
MSILVTGGAGYIGSHTVLLLLEYDYDVVVIDDFSNSSYESLRRVEHLTNKHIKFYQGSILDKDLLNNVFSENDISDVIHFAGLKSVSESVINPLHYYSVNVSGTLSLLNTMKDYKVKSFIFSSSATVYGKPDRLPLKEESNTGNTTNPYGTSKHMVEQILFDLAKTCRELTITVLRYFNPVGAHPSGLIGENPNGIPNNLVPYISQVASGKLECLNIFGNDYPTIDGTGVRDYIHVMDLAAGHINALEKRDNLSNINVFNLGTGIGYSVLEIIHAFELVSGCKINYSFSSRRAGDIAECWSDPTHSNKILDWYANYSLEDMMRDTWNWQRNNPDGYPK